MSDSFADLWSSTAPASSKQPAKSDLKTLGSTKQPSSPPASNATSYGSARNDIFSMLASTNSPSGTSSSKPVSRSMSPSIAALQGQTRPPIASSSTLGRPSSTTPSNGSADAFSSLLGGSIGSATTNKTLGSMTIADRHAETQRERVRAAEREREAREKEKVVWSGLDMIVSGSTSSSSGRDSAGTKAIDNGDVDDLDDFLGLSTPSPKPSPAIPDSKALDNDDWGLSEFASAPSKPDLLRPQHGGTSSRTPSPLIQSTATDNDPMDDFDFGNREDRAGNRSGDEDDILGVLAKPANASRKSVSVRPVNAQSSSTNTNRSSSPPPHILGQIVEMGFSPQQARVALAATDSGTDVQQALEMLLQNGVPGGEGLAANVEGDMAERRRIFTYDDDDDPPAPRPSRRTTSSRVLSASQTSVSASSPPAPNGASTPTAKDIQERADKLLAQASEIGLSVFSKANSFWREGKEKAMKVYEERASAAAGGSAAGLKRAGSGNGRPKWMADVPKEDGWEDGAGGEGSGSGFRDLDGEEEHAPSLHKQHSNPRAVQALPTPKPNRVADLFGNDEPVYISPSRRRGAAPSSIATSSTSQPPKPALPPPLRRRPSISVNSSALSSSTAHKETGTSHFKLGRYADATASYTSALSSLPPSHILRVPLHNNRALARIRCGDHSGAVEDCTAALDIIGLDYHPARETKVTREECGAGVDLANACVKAYRRRAEAHEGREKWEMARRDWEAMLALEWIGKERTDAVNGITRCRRMEKIEIETPSAPQVSPAVAPKPAPTKKPQPSSSSASQTFEAVSALRATNAALEAEDNLRAQLKDTVDARLSAWRGGKESNLRALLASLDSVLWVDLGWKTVGMAELVSPGQVKSRYTRAISKVHPDKLNPRNTTLEQRMIANGVFATLNEAWSAFSH